MRIDKAASTLAPLTARVWANPKLSVKSNMAVYNVCVTRTLLYSSEPWTAYAGKERRRNTFHPRSIRRIIGTSWQDNDDVLSRAGLPDLFPLCTLCLDNAGCDGLVISTVWRMVASQTTSYFLSGHRKANHRPPPSAI